MFSEGNGHTYKMNGSEKRGRIRTRDVCCLMLLGVFIFAVAFVGGILVGIYAYHGVDNNDTTKVECVVNSQNTVDGQVQPTTPSLPISKEPMGPENCKKCNKRNPVIPQVGPEIFAPLSKDEMNAVRKHMMDARIISKEIGNNLTLKSDYIMSMDIIAPSKRNVLKHLDDNGAFPGRYASVIVIRGSRNVPDCMEYLVGPLGSDTMSATQQYADGETSFNARPIDDWDAKRFATFLKPLEAILDKLINESFDGANFASGTINWWLYNSSPGVNKNEREVKVSAFFNPSIEHGDFHLLDMLPLSVTIHCPGTDLSTWFVHRIYYISQGPFNTPEELMQAYNGNSIRKVKLPAGYRDSLNHRRYVGRDQTLGSRANANMPPPRTYEPEGPRYTIKGHNIQWMGWSFDTSVRMMRGPAVFDVRFNNDRIAYEVSLNDIGLVYGSDSNERSNVVYTDATYAIGKYNGIIKGIDCPEHATVLKTSYYDAFNGVPVTANSICVFEVDGEEAAWRHKANSYQGGLRNSYLVVRLSAILANYDYIVDFHFHLDGKMFTKVKATGFIQTVFWDQDNPNRGNQDVDDNKVRDAFGFKVTDYGHGIIHDHMFGFKVDMDVLGTNNSFEIIHFKSGNVVDSFKKQNPSITETPEYFTFNYTRYVEYETVQKETGYRINPESPKFWTVVNENRRNKWGAKRGYQIVPLGNTVQTLSEAHPAMGALSFTKYSNAVTKYRDSERFMSSLFDSFRLSDVKGDLERLINDENIRNEDLVNWVTVGFLHVPTSEDVPMTMSVESGFLLKPFNFFDKTNIYDMPSYYTSVYGHNESPPAVDGCVEPDLNE